MSMVDVGGHIKFHKFTSYGMQRANLTLHKIYGVVDKDKFNGGIFVINDNNIKTYISPYDYKDVTELPQDDQCEFSLNTYQVLLDESLLKNDIEWSKELHDRYIGIVSK